MNYLPFIIVVGMFIIALACILFIPVSKEKKQAPAASHKCFKCADETDDRQQSYECTNLLKDGRYQCPVCDEVWEKKTNTHGKASAPIALLFLLLAVGCPAQTNAMQRLNVKHYTIPIIRVTTLAYSLECNSNLYSDQLLSTVEYKTNLFGPWLVKTQSVKLLGTGSNYFTETFLSTNQEYYRVGVRRPGQ